MRCARVTARTGNGMQQHPDVFEARTRDPAHYQRFTAAHLTVRSPLAGYRRLRAFVGQNQDRRPPALGRSTGVAPRSWTAGGRWKRGCSFGLQAAATKDQASCEHMFVRSFSFTVTGRDPEPALDEPVPISSHCRKVNRLVAAMVGWPVGV